MIRVSRRLLDRCSVFDVHDPADMDTESRVSQRFPNSNNFNTYVLRDPALRRLPPQAGAPLTRLAMCTAGDLMAAFVADRFGTRVGIVSSSDRFCLAMPVRGSFELNPAGGGPTALASGTTGLVYRGEPGTEFLTGDGNARFNLWVTADRVERALEGLLGETLRRPLVFAPSLDWSAGLGATLHGMIGLLVAELERGTDGLGGNQVALTAYTDMLVQTMLQGLPHSHTELLRSGRRADVVPRHLRRAEEFMRAHAAEPIALGTVAAASGCSLRTLHDAFRRWRETTPLAALHRIRLDLIRVELERADGAAPTMATARRFGFTNRARFLSAYRRQFGASPPGAGRRAGRPE